MRLRNKLMLGAALGIGAAVAFKKLVIDSDISSEVERRYAKFMQDVDELTFSDGECDDVSDAARTVFNIIDKHPYARNVLDYVGDKLNDFNCACDGIRMNLRDCCCAECSYKDGTGCDFCCGDSHMTEDCEGVAEEEDEEDDKCEHGCTGDHKCNCENCDGRCIDDISVDLGIEE